MSDSEIITISIVGELLTIDSEKSWFSFCKNNLTDLFPRFCDRSRFNRTRRALHKVIEIIRDKITSLLGYSFDPYRIIDSMPFPVCHFGRAVFHKTFREYDSYGKCVSKKETYYGFKLHLLTTLNGYVTDFVLTTAGIDDRAAVWELIDSYHSITLVGDKGYISKALALELKNKRNISLIPLKRKNNKDQYPSNFRHQVFTLRRRIETSGSQLSSQINLQRVLAKSLWGLITRIKTKILAHSICYYINKLLGREVDIAKIKELVFG